MLILLFSDLGPQVKNTFTCFDDNKGVNELNPYTVFSDNLDFYVLCIYIYIYINTLCIYNYIYICVQ